MSSVLVAYATKMGATREIAEVIAAVLRERSLQVTLADTDESDTAGVFDARVVGSAIYLGRWRPSAVRLLTRLAQDAPGQPLWLFQSGPFEAVSPGSSAGTPAKVARLAERLGAHGPVTFGGRIEAATARGFIARRMATAETAGDHRDFGQIRSWASSIADQLIVPAVSGR